MGIKLRELEAQFLKARWRTEQTPQVAWTGPFWSYRRVDVLAEADGIRFLCPLCWRMNDGPVGTHVVMIGFVGCPKDAYSKDFNGNDVAWHAHGTGYDDLVLTPSINLDDPLYIQVEGGCRWHGFVGSGGVPPGEAG